MLGTKTDFVGRDGFSWWIGEVESVEDPAQTGRVKVRIMGWHQKGKTNDDGSSTYLEDLPTEVLPWATVLLPNDKPQIKNAGSTCELQVGAFVMGFFMDGDEAQLPCVLGAFRGFKKKTNQGGGSGGEEGQDTEVSKTVIADNTEAEKDEYATTSPQRKSLTGEDVEGGHPFVKNQGATTGGPEGGEEQSRGAISRAEVEAPFNVYTNPLGPPSMEGGIADGIHGPIGASDSFSKDLARMLNDIGVQIGSLGSNGQGGLVSVVSGHIQQGNNILKSISNVSNFVVNAVTGMVAPIKEILAQQIRVMIDAVVSFGAKIIPLAVVTTIITLIKNIIQNIFCQPVPGWLDAIGNIMGMIGDFVDGIFDLVMDIVNKIINQIAEYVTKALKNIQKAICKAIKAVSKVFNKILKAISTIDKISEIATSVGKFFEIDFTALTNFSNVLNIIALIVDIIASFIDCGRKARKPKAKGWLPLVGTTECADVGDGLYGPGGNSDSDDCSSFGEEGSGGNFFDKFFQKLNPYVMETKLFLNGARDIDDATPGKEKRIRSGPGGVTSFQDKLGNEHQNIPGNETQIIGRDLIHNVKNNHVHTIEGDYYLKVMGDFHLEVSGSFNEHTSNGAGAKAKGGGSGGGNPLGQDNNQWTKQASDSIENAVQIAAGKNVSIEAGEKESKSTQTKAGDHAISYQGDLTLQGNQVKVKGISGITLDAPDVHTSATSITNKATGEIVNEASWITSFLACGRMDIIAIFQTMPVFTGSYSLVNGSIVDICMDAPMGSVSPAMHVRMSLGTKTAAGMADIVAGSNAGAHMTLVSTPTGGIGEIVTGGSGAIVNQVTTGLLSHGCGTGLAAFGCALGPTQIYGLPVMLN